MEQEKEVRVIQVDYKCPKCEMGHLRGTGTVLSCMPPIFPSKCNNNNCDYGENLRRSYPYIKYEEI